jgi:peptidylprolyl isomerase
MTHKAALFVLMLTLTTAASGVSTQGQKQIPAPPDVAAPPTDAEKTASGIASKVITPGKGGEKPKSSDLVTVHYTGWTTDGKMFDSSRARNAPSTFPLERVIAGWRECVVAAPPSDAKRTPTGLAFKVLKPGTGTAHPMSRSRVTVHYTGWTTDGKMFDSSVMRGQPATFGLDQVIKGWTDGVQLMVEGEKTRFWIPQDLAYKGASDGPRGMLVFDIELIKIEK